MTRSLPSPFGIATLSEACRRDAALTRSVAERARTRASAIADRNVWIQLCDEAEIAAQLEAAIARHEAGDVLPLLGVPYAIKDNIDAIGMQTTAACPSYAYRAERDAHVVARLRAAGAILIGKTNMDQFATGLVGTRSPYGVCGSALDARYISGGSSSGSALAVALGAVSFALGTDTAGSGRVPAAFNNIVGLKPSRGLLSTSGVVPACRSLDCVSIFSGSAADAADVFAVAAGFDPADPFARRQRRVTAPGAFGQRPRLGVPRPRQREFFGDAAAAATYDATIAKAADRGADLVEIDFSPFADCARLLYEGPFIAERYAAVGAFLEQPRDDIDPTVRAIILGGRELRAATAFQAMERLQALCRETESTWRDVDALLLPTAPSHYRVDEVLADPIGKNSRLGYYTNFVNLMDLCGVAVPAGMREDGLPFGITLLAPALSETALLSLGGRLHRLADVPIGATQEPLTPDTTEPSVDEAGETIDLAVCGAHLAGQPLHYQLSERAAVLVKRTRTAAAYRFFALDTAPPKPGLVYEAGFAGPGIEVEVWRLAARDFGEFVDAVPAPLAIGKVTLEDDSEVSGFVCEPRAIANAREITALGGWRAFVKG